MFKSYQVLGTKRGLALQQNTNKLKNLKLPLLAIFIQFYF